VNRERIAEARARLEESRAFDAEIRRQIGDSHPTVTDVARKMGAWIVTDDLADALDEIERLRAEVERLRQERADALNVMSRDGLLSSEWVLRTGKAEHERDEAHALLRDIANSEARGVDFVPDIRAVLGTGEQVER